MTDIYQALTTLDEQLARAIAASQSNTDELLSVRTQVTALRETVKPKPLPELAAYLVDNGSYGTALTSRLKACISVLAKSQFKRVILFQNYLQMVQDKFPQVIVDAGLEVVFDTMYSVRRTTTDKQFAEYMAQAETFKPPQFRFDDCHNQSPEEIAAIVRFMRQFTDKPIIGTFGADDFKTVNGKRVAFDMQAYVDAGLLVSRQFFRQSESVDVLDGWLKSKRITHGIDLEAFPADGVTTSPKDFTDMLLKCLNAGVEILTVYAVVDGQRWQMWKAAPELWQAVQTGAVTVRLWKQ